MNDGELARRLDRLEEALGLLRHPLPPPLLRVSEVAGRLKVSPATVRRYIASGEMKAVLLSLGRTVAHRVRQGDLADFLDWRATAKRKGSEPEGRLIRVPRVTPFD